MMFSDVIFDITFPGGLSVFQSFGRFLPLSNVGGLTVGATDLLNCSLSIPQFVHVFNIEMTPAFSPTSTNIKPSGSEIFTRLDGSTSLDVASVKGEAPLSQILKNFSTTHIDDQRPIYLEVHRSAIWKRALTFYKQAMGEPYKLKQRLSIGFDGEEGIDAGALRVEFFCEVLQEMNKRLFEGDECHRVPKKTFHGGTNYAIAGMMIGHSLLQNGPAFPCMPKAIYSYITTGCIEIALNQLPTIGDIPLDASTSNLHEFICKWLSRRALSTCPQMIPLWSRYIDNTFTAVRHKEFDAFHHPLNIQNTDRQFTREIQENGKVPFLHGLVSCDDNPLKTTVNRKLTYTDTSLDESSFNPKSHKATIIRPLTRCTQLVCNTTDSSSDNNKYLFRVFSKNNNNDDFIQRNTHRPTTTTKTNDSTTSTATATIPYRKGMSENISHLLQPINIRIAHKSITTLRQLLTYIKEKDEPRNRQGAIYKINCSDCQASYVRETGRNLATRLTEHRQATRKGDVNHIPEHHRHTNHNIDWDSRNA
ncbi:hypothetical protein AWC38_SpisGene10962 [Stylophora pistillata]|uniref:HECT domain-containing protein n=1 Tax=Stylophora pistillata TaxID=50429 RepID=A0A2B4S183_STYPI|nr:hypothetical protein AWC38_SpisGene10962 [Stylophora pistillata]